MNGHALSRRVLDRVLAVVRRETLEITRNRVLLGAIAIPPLVFVLIPVGAATFGGSDPLPPPLLARVVAAHPSLAGLDTPHMAAAFGISQLVTFFLLMPATVPLAIAAYSIVGEKQTRSLEAVLAAPIGTGELLAGKAIAAVVPGVLTVWVAYGFVLGFVFVRFGAAVAATAVEPSWLVAVFVLGPAISLGSVVTGIVISSRVNDPRAAQQLGTLLVLPIVGLGVAQAQGGAVVSTEQLGLAAGVIAVAAIVGLRFGVALFGRESILTRWR